MTAAAFVSRMHRLMGLKFAPTSLDTHWEGLRDLGDDEIDAAIERAARECDEFPAPKMLRMFVDEYRARVIPLAPDREREIAPVDVQVPQAEKSFRINREWRYYDERCSDTGWVSMWCGASQPPKPWLERGFCGRSRPHSDHEFVVECPCASSNPDVIRKRAVDRQVSRKGAES